MTMRFVSVDNGRAWEWMHEQRQFRATWVNGSPVVALHFRSVEDDDTDWMISHTRATDGRSARSVAEQMYRDITGREPGFTDDLIDNITSQMRITKTWYCDTGPHAGLMGVALAPLYLTRDELEALQAAHGWKRDHRFP